MGLTDTAPDRCCSLNGLWGAGKTFGSRTDGWRVCVERINESCFCFSVGVKKKKKKEFISLFSLLTSQVNTEMKLHKFTLSLVYN